MPPEPITSNPINIVKAIEVTHKPECSRGESCTCGFPERMARLPAVHSLQLRQLLTMASLTQMDPDEYD